MRKRTRITGLLLALLLGISLLGGCGSKPADSKVSDTPESSAGSAAQESDAQESDTAQESESAAGSQAEAGVPDTSEEVTLVMYLIGDRPADNDEVFAKINEKLIAEMNATIEVKFMRWGEYEKK